MLRLGDDGSVKLPFVRAGLKYNSRAILQDQLHIIFTLLQVPKKKNEITTAQDAPRPKSKQLLLAAGGKAVCHPRATAA
jgi:hypothetical protein